MTGRAYNVLFLCTGNSARSQMAEALLNELGGGRFRAFSAGSHPGDEVHPITLAMIERAGLSTEGLRAKSWDAFAAPGAPRLDFVFTVCDKAAAETCPVWPGQPLSAHWGFPDPAAFEGPEAERWAVFADVFRQIQSRIRLLANLPVERLDRLSLQRSLDEMAPRRGGEDEEAAS